MSYYGNASTGKVPMFGVPGTVRVGTEVADRDWDITSITITPGSDLWEGRDANGKIVSRIHFNQGGVTSAPDINRSTTITINYVPVGTTAANAETAGAIVHNGKTFVISASNVPGLDSVVWECTGNSVTAANTDGTTMVLNGVYAASNA